ncbi:putative serine protease HtrA [Ruminiclostridium hungatei]|uniref:Putative serine protease HtrA n=1 Tax=Ruminiclostridium hungatei TaxID=48256 RepID=A0A1V4SKR0_RUMHU|nr:DUF5050 domain-containing protein [Ruminiclostridium hungatei]OPX44479.1 putative serine protease HtrA [Ruminiclostridium hungatei]
MHSKKSKYVILLMLFVFTIISSTCANAAVPSIKINFRGEPLTLGTSPVSDAGVLMAPMNSILDSLDTVYDFNTKTKTIAVSKEGKNLQMTQGSTKGLLNGKSVKLPKAPGVIGKQMFIPLEFVCNTFGFDFNWNKSTNTASISLKNSEKGGNTSGNISNYGYVAPGGEWSYVSLDNSGLYKIKNDDSQRVKLLTPTVSCLNIYKDWIYYVNDYYASAEEKLRLYKVKTDGSSKTKLLTDKISYLNLSGEWLYYINESDNNKLYKMRVDGKGKKRLGNDSLTGMIVEDGWIYYQKSNDKNLFKMRTGGTDVKKLAEDAVIGTIMVKSDNWIYYEAYDGVKYTINKVDQSGRNKSSIIQARVNAMNSIGKTIYYSDFSGNLYRLDENQRVRTKIGYSMGEYLNQSNDWLYYTIFSEDYEGLNTEYRIKADGQLKQKFDLTGNTVDILRLADSHILPEYTPGNLTAPNPETGLLAAKEIARQKNAVVHIKIFDDNENLIASGSGFNIQENGVIATNFHVISGAAAIKCIFDNNSSYEVDYVLNYSELKDIALLHLKDAKGLPVLRLSDSDRIELAEDVLAIGNPMELQNTVSNGIVSGRRKFFGIDFIQTTASISAGSSGGPLFNMSGNVIGITSMTLSGAQNINFAIPINYIKELYKSSRAIPLGIVNNYDNTLQEFENNNSIPAANYFLPDQSISGNIGDGKDVDYFKFTLEKDTSVSFFGLFVSGDSTSAAKAMNLTLLDKDGRELSKSTLAVEEGEYSVQKITATLSGGTYYISVKKNTVDKAALILDNYSILTVAD